MRINKHVALSTTILLSSMLLVCSGEGSEQAGQVPGAHHAKCVIRITAGAEIMPPDLDVVESLVRSDGVTGKAARDVLADTPGWSDEFMEIRPLSGLRAAPRDVPPDDQAAEAPTSVGEPTMLLSLSVNLPDDTKPVARELVTAVIENLRRELHEAFNAHAEWLKLGLNLARTERSTAYAAFSDVVKEVTPKGTVDIRLDPADEAVYRQLDTVVNLSSLRPEMPLQEAADIIRRSVNPPLMLVVLWRDLSENAMIQPSTPINMDGLPNVKLGAGLSNLLGAMSNPQADIRVDYVVAGGVITIGTKESLPRRRMEMRVHELPVLLRAFGQTGSLPGLIQQTIEPDSWFDLSESGEGTIMLSGDARLIVSQTPDVHRKIAELLRATAEKSPITTPTHAPREVLEQQIESLLAYRSTLEREIDKLQEQQQASTREKNDFERRAMSSELYSIVDNLQAVRSRIVVGDRDSPEADGIDRAVNRIMRCADRSRQSTPKPDGSLDDSGLPWHPASNEDQTLSRRLMIKQAELEQVSRRIAGIQDALIGRTRFDPEVHRLQMAATRLEEADLRIRHLESQIARLQACTVTIFGELD